MIIDVRFKQKGSKQYQKIRLMTVYPEQGIVKPEVIFHSEDYIEPPVFIPLDEIHSLTVSND